MHLLIDVRTSCLSDLPNLYYAETWADIWLSYHKNDKITFLAFEGDPVRKHECIFISRKWSLFQKKLAAHNYWPDRIISFSSLPPIDISTPTILHVSDLRMKHYEQWSMNILTQKILERSMKKLYSSAKHIIVPWKEIGSELEELYAINESHIAVLPYLTKNIEKESFSSIKKVALTHGISDEYFITEGTPTDEWQPIQLIQAYSKYIHEKNGHEELLILWDMGENFDKIVTLIRALGLLYHVKIIGILSKEDREDIYRNSKGWIYIGYYYSRWASVELAHSYSIPLYLSDIPGLSGYNGIYIHPNHMDQLVNIISTPEAKGISHMKNDNQDIMQVYTRIISE